MKFLHFRSLSFSLLFFLLLSNTIHAQVSVKGTISDSSLAIPFASVALLNTNDSSLVKSAICNENGMYQFEGVMPGNYMIRSFYVGFADAFSNPFAIDSSAYVVPALVLVYSNTNLKEVTVSTFKKTIDIKNGMIIMNVEESPLTAGNSVFELLKKIPGVYVDNQDNISLNGKSGVGISIDGRLQQLSGAQLVALLTGMNADNISKIEVMENPPPKYDAAGSGGIINIVTKKVKVVGFSGNINGGVSQAVAFRGNADCSLNYKGKKFTLYSNLGYGHRVFYDKYKFDRSTSINGNTTYLNETGYRYNTQKSNKGLLGGEFYLTEKTTVGFSASLGSAGTPVSEVGVNKVNGYNDLGFDYTDFYSDVDDKWSFPDFNINAEHQFDTLGTSLRVAADYSGLKGTRKAVSRNYFFDPSGTEVLPANIYRSTLSPDIKIGTFRLDFNKTIFKEINLEAGVKFTLVDNLNNYTFEKKDNITQAFVYSPLYSNVYKYSENIEAGYFNLKKQFKKSTLNLGARIESTNVRGNNVTSGYTFRRSYVNFFPNIRFDYSQSDDHSFIFSISRRLDRPGYNMLNPYKSYQDQYSSTVGNADLTPQYSYNFEGTHGYKRMLYSTLTYTHTTDYILPYDFQNDSTKETTSTVKNISSYNYYACSVFFQKTALQWWDVTASVSAFYHSFEGKLNGVAINRSSPALIAFVNNDFALSGKFKISLTGQYMSQRVSGIAVINDKWNVDIGVKKSMFNDRLTLQLIFVDLFYTDVYNMTSKFQTQNYSFIDREDTRRVRFALSYKFGKVKIQKQDNSTNQQEKERLEKKLKE
ncbi:MAG: hypothetical protein JWO44_2308 [Bacteroidetes bacterium]|nr:hypothetical protein [Bacteroidota bacterium]